MDELEFGAVSKIYFGSSVMFQALRFGKSIICQLSNRLSH